jgi:hypothetical protein
MCVNCVTQAEAVAFQILGVTTIAGAALDKLQALASPEAWAIKKVRAWEENAAFMASMGLDPVAVLGQAPSPEPARPRLAVRWAVPAPAV